MDMAWAHDGSHVAKKLRTTTGSPFLMVLSALLLRATAGAAVPWPPPPLIVVGKNATDTDRYAAASLHAQLRDTLGMAAAHVATAGRHTAGAPQLAVGYSASLAAGIPAGQLQGLGDDGYILLPLAQGGAALGASRGSARGSMNAAYGFLHAGGMRFLAENVTAMDSNISAGGLMGRAVHPPLEARYALSRAALPCSTDHCPTNISAALGFNGPHAHAPGGLWTQVEALQRYQLSNGATIGADNSDVYALLAAGMLPLEPWVEHCVNSSSVGWNTTYTPGAGGAGPKCTLREVPCPTVFRAHPEFFVCSGSSPSAAGQRGTPPAAASGGGAEAAAAAAAVWPCTFDLMYQRQPYGYNPRERFSTGVAHMCWTGSPVRACQ